MCGINGFISPASNPQQREQIVRKMNEKLSHRGPDNDGIWSEDAVTLGHRRLSIIDLSAAGNQPFSSGDNRYTIVYNGELYNYKDLKLELQRAPHGSDHKPYFFKTDSDTEVVIAAYSRWGAECLNFFRGMYAFAIYDRQEKKLFAARDRMGVKPFYYSYGNEGFVFSSEVRGILNSGVRGFSLNKNVLAEYLMYQTVYAPETIIKEIKVLMPGHYLEYKEGKASVTHYYDLNKKINEKTELSYEETCAKIKELLTHSVQLRLIADVPFGAFLSGGIDSSAVVGLMSEVSTEKVNTFNISFDESEFSESIYARQIAKKFNTQHHEIRLQPADFLQQLPEALAAMDHPGGDGPNTYLVSKATKKAGITMALSGIGGDELFAGYDVFKRMSALRKKAWLNAIPQIARKTAGAIVKGAKKNVGGQKMGELLGEKEISFNSAYPLSRSLFTNAELQKLMGGSDPFFQLKKITANVPQLKDHLLSAVSLCEINSYLQNVLLRDADQMSMAVALEVREPFLDHHLAEFVLSVKDEFKYPHTPKKLLVDSLGDLLPNEIVNRPKMGFTLPWQHWLRNELKSFCEENIHEFVQRDLGSKKNITELWQKYLKGDPTVTWSRVWHIVVLNNWLKQNNISN
jgi:asparagine synthase (glutamine-hydrolysing)